MQAPIMANVGDLRIEDPNGEVRIAASQRADGSWRPEIRVKKGYVPQEEIGAWKSKSMLARQSSAHSTPVVSVRKEPSAISVTQVMSRIIEKEQLWNEHKRKQETEAREKKSVAETVTEPLPISVTESIEERKPESILEMTKDNLQKNERRLRKKLRQIISLEEKCLNGEDVQKEQRQKILTKGDIEKELNDIVEEIEKRD